MNTNGKNRSHSLLTTSKHKSTKEIEIPLLLRCPSALQKIINQPLRRAGPTRFMITHFDELSSDEVVTLQFYLGKTSTNENLDPPKMMKSEFLYKIYSLFESKVVDDIAVYRMMRKFIMERTKSSEDMQQMVYEFIKHALDCSVNVGAVCKYLYVLTHETPLGEHLRSAFFGKLEKNFTERDSLECEVGPIKYRNFIRCVMAAAHHYRNLSYAPFDELTSSLVLFADEVSSFCYAEDIPLYVTLILRYYYYSSLPYFDGSFANMEDRNAVLNRARIKVRQRLSQGRLTDVQRSYLILLIEVTRSSPLIEQDIRDCYQEKIPDFIQLLPDYLKIKLPQEHTLTNLKHLSDFIILTKDP